MYRKKVIPSRREAMKFRKSSFKMLSSPGLFGNHHSSLTIDDPSTVKVRVLPLTPSDMLMCKQVLLAVLQISVTLRAKTEL